MVLLMESTDIMAKYYLGQKKSLNRIHLEDIIILNVYTLNYTELKYIKQKLTKL